VSDGEWLSVWRGEGRKDLSVSFFFENDIFAVCHDLAHGKHFLLTFSIYFFFKLAHGKHFLLIFLIYFFFKILCCVSHI